MRFNPKDYPICKSPARRTNPRSAWAGHIPFAMCSIAMLRPRVFVELGTEWGVSYCAFCQAVEELHAKTRCYAIDTWKGDAQCGAYGERVFEDLSGYHHARYSRFSQLVRCTFDEAVPQFLDGSIDLLHIDGFHSYDAVRHDFEAWLPKVGGLGVVLFHDICVTDREGFGVHKFWSEVKEIYPHFEFHHSCGLGVLGVGGSVPREMDPFFSSTPEEADEIRAFFSQPHA